jgi:hypothetical protein
MLRAWSAAGAGPGGSSKCAMTRTPANGSKARRSQNARTAASFSRSESYFGQCTRLRSRRGCSRHPARVSAQAIRNSWKRLKSSWLNRATVVGQAIQDELAGAQALLHGDLVPSNIILTGRGPVAIDPVGYRGPAAWDLAQLAVALAGIEKNLALESEQPGGGASSSKSCPLWSTRFEASSARRPVFAGVTFPAWSPQVGRG